MDKENHEFYVVIDPKWQWAFVVSSQHGPTEAATMALEMLFEEKNEILELCEHVLVLNVSKQIREVLGSDPEVLVDYLTIHKSVPCLINAGMHEEARIVQKCFDQQEESDE